MATVGQVVPLSLGLILVQASEAPIEASEAQDFIFDMNAYMLALDATGITLGYTEVSDLGDTITIPTGALLGLIYNMAIVEAGRYNKEIPASVATIAATGMDAMEQLGVTLSDTHFPSTLPIGSGNEWPTGWRQWHFYPDLEAQILAETSGAIGLETGTEEAAP